MFVNLGRRLEAWTQAGLISESQSAAIAAYEKTNARPWSLYGLTGIGVMTVATGVISLIAANWSDIPSFVKLLGYFLLQAALGVWAIRQLPRSGIWREASLLLYALGFLAGIGLVAQIYHLGGSGWRALAFWLFLTAPVVLRAEGALFNHGWVLTLLYTAAVWSIEYRHPGLTDELRVSLAATIPLTLTGLGFFSERFFSLPRAFREAILTWGLASVLIAGTITGNVLWHTGGHRELQKFLNYLALPWCALLFAAAGSWLRGPATPRALRGVTAVTLIACGVYFTLPFFLPPDSRGVMVNRIIGAGGFILIGLLCSAAAALGQYRRLYDLATALVTIRILMIYFEIFGSMTSTGLGLILTGGLILGLARVWQKYRGPLLHWMEGKR